MVAVRVGIQVRYEQALAQVSRWGLALKPGPLLYAIGARQLKWITDNIREGGIDEPWTEMAPSTIAARPVRSSGHTFSSRWASRLAQSFAIDVSEQEGTVDVGTEDQFAEWQHEGTPPHDIYPRNAAFLRFQTDKGVRFAPFVHNPGIPARPLVPTKDVAEQMALEVLEAVVEKLEAQDKNEEPGG